LTRKQELIFLKTLRSKEQSRGKEKILSESKISTKDLLQELEKRLSELIDSLDLRGQRWYQGSNPGITRMSENFWEVDIPKIKETNQDF
jgi:hypothetical protein